MSHSHRSHRRRRRRGGRIPLVATIAGVVVTAGVVVVLRPGFGDGSGPAAAGEPAGQAPPTVAKPTTGPPLKLVAADGTNYTVEAVRGGTTPTPPPGAAPPAPGTGYPYAEYVLTNAQGRAVPLDLPPDLFLRRTLVPADALNRCIPRLGTPKDLCTVASDSRIVGRLPGTAAPVQRDSDTYLPAGGSYLVRMVAEVPVAAATKQADLGVFVWAVRFTRDRIARPAPFPA